MYNKAPIYSYTDIYKYYVEQSKSFELSSDNEYCTIHALNTIQSLQNV